MLALPAAEFAVWLAYYAEHGFPGERQEWATAIGAAALCQTWGGKVRPADLIPRFRPADPAARRSRIMAWFDGLTPERFAGRNGGQ